MGIKAGPQGGREQKNIENERKESHNANKNNIPDAKTVQSYHEGKGQPIEL